MRAALKFTKQSLVDTASEYGREVALFGALDQHLLENPPLPSE